MKNVEDKKITGYGSISSYLGSVFRYNKSYGKRNVCVFVTIVCIEDSHLSICNISQAAMCQAVASS